MLDFSLHTGLILLTLIALETVLSADNAVALATLIQPLPHHQQQPVLNAGLAIAFGLRIGLLFAATWIIQFWQVEFCGALYLLWLGGTHFWPSLSGQSSEGAMTNSAPLESTHLGRLIGLIALTDLAFSLDSVTTAVALSDRLWLLVIGCLVGVITLRFMAALFVRWLEEFTYLQDAAYLAVLGVGLRLLVKAMQPDLDIPDGVMIALVGLLFTWGFSQRANPVEVPALAAADLEHRKPPTVLPRMLSPLQERS